MKRTCVTAAFAMLLLVHASCTPRAAQSASRSSSVEITAAEIDTSTYSDAHTLVQALRPNWLRVRGPTSFGRTETVRVYMDGMELGGAEYLRQIPTSSLRSIRYFDGLEATQRWGLDHGGGAIVISTRDARTSA